MALALSGAAGAAIPLGGAAANWIRLGDGHYARDTYDGVLMFGGGILFAAVAIVLVPEGIANLDPLTSAGAVLAGSLFFLFGDAWADRHGGGASNVMATVLDYTPESVALGAAFAVGGTTGPLLALLIGLQNLIEGFNSFKELTENGMKRARVFALLGALVILGPIAAGIGFIVLADKAGIVGFITLFAAGGILFGVFHDLAPKAARNCHYSPTLGASLGFLAGVIGHMLLA